MQRGRSGSGSGYVPYLAAVLVLGLGLGVHGIVLLTRPEWFPLGQADGWIRSLCTVLVPALLVLPTGILLPRYPRAAVWAGVICLASFLVLLPGVRDRPPALAQGLWILLLVAAAVGTLKLYGERQRRLLAVLLLLLLASWLGPRQGWWEPEGSLAIPVLALLAGLTLARREPAPVEVEVLADGTPPRQHELLLSVIMPVFNERSTVAAVVRRVLAVELPLDRELVIVDDGSTDGTREILTELASCDPRVRLLAHAQNRGKGAALATGIARSRGHLVIIQDADLEYEPGQYMRLLTPILEGRADAVYGSRFTGTPRRVLLFWHSVGNRLLTLCSNMVNDLNLTDMETCYKAFQGDLIRMIRLQAQRFDVEPEITARLAWTRARLYEVPISYDGRTYHEGKKVGLADAVAALFAILRFGLLDRRCLHHEGYQVLLELERASRFNAWMRRRLTPHLGRRVLEIGSGIGTLSRAWLDRELLVLTDRDPTYLSLLRHHFRKQDHVQVHRLDAGEPAGYPPLRDLELDTIVCCNVLEHIEDDLGSLRQMAGLLTPGGKVVLLVPQGPGLYGTVDRAVGHHRRYRRKELVARLEQAGFRVTLVEDFNRLAAPAWWVNGRLLRARSLGAASVRLYSLVTPLARLLEPVLPWPGQSLVAVGELPSAEP